MWMSCCCHGSDCRRLTASGFRVLMSDHRIVCYDATGIIDPGYKKYFVAGAIGVLFWSIGVPAFFAYKLFHHRETISAGNFHFAGVSFLRPLFIFFKPDCYMFEVLFM